jgi:hypothetical protein
MNSSFSRLVLAASVLVWTACSGKKDVTNPPVTTASITVAAVPATLSVAQNAAGTSAITVARTNFTGDVVLTAEGLPTGVTATFTPATLGSGATSSSLSLAVSGTAAVAGPATITIRARGTGVTDATATVALTITASVGGAVTITATPATASITAGQQASTVVRIARAGGFTGGVNFTATGAPTGMTTTFSSANPFTGDSLNLSISTLTSVTPGPYTLTVRANASGLTEATTTYTVTVAAPPSNSVTWRYCDTGRIPLWFAYLDGLTGTWQQVTPTTPGVFTFAYGQPQVGVATVYNEGSKVVTRVAYYGLAEVAGAAAAECTQNPVVGTKTLTGSVSGFASAQEVATVSMGAALSSATNQSTPNFTIPKVPDGAVDLIAVRANLVSSNVVRALIKRGQNVAANGSLGTLDLAAGTSFVPANGSITVSAPNDGALFGQNRITTATGSSASFTTPQLSSGVTAAYQGVPDDGTLLSTDIQLVQVSQAVGTTLNRIITRYTRGPTAVTLTMPADPGAPTITNVTPSVYARASVSGSLPAAFNGLLSVSFDQTGRSRRWDITSTPNGRTGTTTYLFTLPDFSAVAGWQSTWTLGSGATDVTSNFFGQSGTDVNGNFIAGSTQFIIGRLSVFTFP